MVIMYIPRVLSQVDIDVDKFIKYLETLGFKYVFDKEINDEKYAIVKYPNKEEFMVQYKKIGGRDVS